MPICEIGRFVALCIIGDSTLKERQKMVLAHKQTVEGRITELQGHLDHINFKVAYYNAACKAGTEAGLKNLKYPDSKNCCAGYLNAITE